MWNCLEESIICRFNIFRHLFLAKRTFPAFLSDEVFVMLPKDNLIHLLAAIILHNSVKWF